MNKRNPSRYKKKSGNGFMRFYNTKGGKITFVVLSVLLILCGSIMTGTGFLLSKINITDINSFDTVSGAPSDEIDDSLDPNLQVDNNPDAMKFGSGPILSDPNIQNILLIGSDTRGGEKYGRSDSMMVVSINKVTKQIKITSFLRDMYLKINGIQDNRINVAYGHGGPKLLADTIQNNFRIKLDNYVRVDFQSFKKLINLVGGVQITLTKAEANEINSHPGVYFVNGETQKVVEGANLLNGAGALAYSRIRHIDSDFGRTQRQRKVIEALIKTLKSNPTKIVNAADQLLQEVQTDIPRDSIINIALNASSYPISQMSLPAQGAYQSKGIRGMAVLVPDIEKNKAILWKFIYNR